MGGSYNFAEGAVVQAEHAHYLLAEQVLQLCVTDIRLYFLGDEVRFLFVVERKVLRDTLQLFLVDPREVLQFIADFATATIVLGLL